MRRIIWASLFALLLPLASGSGITQASPAGVAHAANCPGNCLIRYSGVGSTSRVATDAATTFSTPRRFVVRWSTSSCAGGGSGFHLTLWTDAGGEQTALFVGGGVAHGTKQFSLAAGARWRPAVRSACAWTFSVARPVLKGGTSVPSSDTSAATIAAASPATTPAAPPTTTPVRATATPVPPTATAIPPTATRTPVAQPAVDAIGVPAASTAGGTVAPPPGLATGATATAPDTSDTQSSIDEVRTSLVASPNVVTVGDAVTVTGVFTNKGLPVAGAPMDTTWDFGGPLGHCSAITDGQGIARCSLTTNPAPIAGVVRVYAQFSFAGKTYPQTTSFTTNSVIVNHITVDASISSTYIHKGDGISVTARTLPGAICSGSISYANGTATESITKTASSDLSTYTFTWVETAQSTIGTFTVSCTLNGETSTQRIVFTVF